MDPIANRPAGAVDSWSRYAWETTGWPPVHAQHHNTYAQRQRGPREKKLFVMLCHYYDHPHARTRSSTLPAQLTCPQCHRAPCPPAGRRPAAADSPGAERPSASMLARPAAQHAHTHPHKPTLGDDGSCQAEALLGTASSEQENDHGTGDRCPSAPEQSPVWASTTARSG